MFVIQLMVWPPQRLNSICHISICHVACGYPVTSIDILELCLLKYFHICKDQLFSYLTPASQ